jgi:hypothetical protein
MEEDPGAGAVASTVAGTDAMLLHLQSAIPGQLGERDIEEINMYKSTKQTGGTDSESGRRSMQG